MKRSLKGISAATLVLVTLLPTTFAATTENSIVKSTITVNGSTLSHPYELVLKDGTSETVYMPMYYIDQALNRGGYSSSWNGTKREWTLTYTGEILDLSGISIGSGNTLIYLNGKLVKKLNTISAVDPSDGKTTTYIPIYYVQQLLKSVGVQNTWNGTTHVWSEGSSVTGSTNISGTTGSEQRTGTFNVTIQQFQAEWNKMTSFNSPEQKSFSPYAITSATSPFTFGDNTNIAWSTDSNGMLKSVTMSTPTADSFVQQKQNPSLYAMSFLGPAFRSMIMGLNPNLQPNALSLDNNIEFPLFKNLANTNNNLIAVTTPVFDFDNGTAASGTFTADGVTYTLTVNTNKTMSINAVPASK